MKKHKKLVLYRKAHDLNQDDVAKMLNMSNVSYSLKETGKQDFRLNEAKALADLFGTSIDDIFFDDSVNTKMTIIV